MDREALRAAALAADDKVVQEVPVPEWGEGAVVYLHTLSVLETIRMQNAAAKYSDPDGAALDEGAVALAANVVFAARDASGAQIFTEDDIAVIVNKQMPVFNRLASVAFRLRRGGEAGLEVEKKG